MKAIYLLSVFCLCTFIALSMFGLLPGCALFKKTSKNTLKDTHTLNKRTELNLLNLKTADKETQIYTYWTDSTFYKYELIKEQVDEARVTQEKTNEKQSAVHQQTVKESKPVMNWIYIGIIAISLFVIGSYLIYRRLYKVL